MLVEARVFHREKIIEILDMITGETKLTITHKGKHDADDVIRNYETLSGATCAVKAFYQTQADYIAALGRGRVFSGVPIIKRRFVGRRTKAS